METLILLYEWADQSLGMKIMDVLMVIAFFVLFVGFGGPALNKTTGRFESVDGFLSELSWLTKLIITIVSIAIILLDLYLNDML
ncbi:MAG: hypothetical protein II401_04920 [Bacteroidales bacterium]|nr:hypothetical protein [Bacteroidales bacterium]